MKYIIILMWIATIQICDSVIYRLNDTEYLRMPPVYHLDDYDSCVYETNGTYCYVDIELVSDIPSDLLQMIHEYSEHTIKHFNHTQLHRGICLTKTCKHLLQRSKVVDPEYVLERCLNESLWKDYKLKARLSKMVSCKKLDDPVNTNIGDIGAALLFASLGLLNVIGSIYDLYFTQGGKGNNILLSFSLKRNFKKLNARDPKGSLRDKLKGFHGLRALSIALVMFVHAPLPMIISTENPHGLEKTYDSIIFHIFYNGTLIMQTFFLITGCLMAYNVRTYSENNVLNWILIPKMIVKRWLRLTPAYAVVLIFTLTWIRFIASGPLWEVAVGDAVQDCLRYGWSNMVYVNNYIDNSQCMAHTWYMAADMQLYILGIFVCVLAKTSRSRNITLIVLFAIGFVIPAFHTYLQDLDGYIPVSPEISRSFFLKDPTFNESYKRGHTNIPGFVIGLALGNLIFEGLKDEKKISKFKKLGYLYNLSVPVKFALVMSGMVFYGDRPRMSIYVRTVVATLIRPVFALLMSILFIGMVFKFEHFYSSILEWRGWRTPARVSYSAYLIHLAVIRVFAGMNTSLMRMGLIQCIKEGLGIIVITFIIAYPFWLFVEAPLNQAFFIIFKFSDKDENDNSNIILDNGRNRIVESNKRK